MSVELFTVILFGSMIILLLTGLPVAFTLGGLAVVFTLITMGPKQLLIIASGAYGEGTNFVLVAVPLFLVMAMVLERSGIAEDFYDAMHKWFGGIPGGLASGTVIICAVFAAMAGISGLATITMGLIALPAMLKHGYDRKMVVGSIACGGALGIIIPPSVIAVLYGGLTGASVGQLFIGGIAPGILIAIIMMIYITTKCLINPAMGPAVPIEEQASWSEKIASLKSAILPVALILTVLGSIYSGVCTATEASAIGAIGAIICTVVNKRFNWKDLATALQRALNATCMALWIVFCAKSFSAVYVAGGAAHLVQDTVLGLPFSPLAIIFMMQIIVFLLGMLIDPAGILMICVPVFLPIVMALGYDPVWFGILFILNSGMAYITPPFGFNLFYMRSIVPKDMGMGEIYQSVWPFVGIQALVLILVLLFPEIAMWLPNNM